MIIRDFDMSVDCGLAGLDAPQERPTLTSYILDTELISRSFWKSRPAVIVCPGGGYRSRSVREAEAVALKFCAAGFHAFVLNYSVGRHAQWPIPQCQLSKAVMTVRELSGEYCIDSENVYVCGFSAGGHLAAALGVYWDDPVIRRGSGASGEINRPDGLILCYPVIIADDDKTHRGTKRNFIGGEPRNAALFGLDKHVTERTPESFIWHTFEDDSVPVYSSLRFAEALYERGVSCELHVFPNGRHGLALGSMITACEPKHIVKETDIWIDLAVKWLGRHIDTRGCKGFDRVVDT